MNNGGQHRKSRPLRLLKFDSVYPFETLQRKQESHRQHLLGLSYEKYYEWLMAQRMGFSDFLTYYMNEAGWDAREVLSLDDILLQKLPTKKNLSLKKEIYESIRHIGGSSLKSLVTLRAFQGDEKKQREKRLENYIRTFQPDVLFIREPSHTDGKFWDRFRDQCLLVAFMGCTTLDPWNWNTHRHDLIFTLTEEYLNFFRAEGVESHLFSYGIDERLAKEVAHSEKKYDCAFVGWLGTVDQRAKTKLLEAVAQSVDFKWWGPKGPELGAFPALNRTWQGTVAGLEMFQIYKQAKVVVNEYPEMAVSKNVNMRTMEVLNVGSFLLTRAATNIEWLEKEGALVTFSSQEDCLAKLRQYLADEKTREKIAAQGLRTALKHFNYRDITRGVMDVITTAWEKKKGKLKGWSAR